MTRTCLRFLTNGVQTQDNPACIESARKAVSVIAEHRNSDRLRQFLHEGTMTEPAARLLSAAKLRSLAPPTMNVELRLAERRGA